MPIVGTGFLMSVLFALLLPLVVAALVRSRLARIPVRTR